MTTATIPAVHRSFKIRSERPELSGNGDIAPLFFSVSNKEDSMQTEHCVVINFSMADDDVKKGATQDRDLAFQRFGQAGLSTKFTLYRGISRATGREEVLAEEKLDMKVFGHDSALAQINLPKLKTKDPVLKERLIALNPAYERMELAEMEAWEKDCSENLVDLLWAPPHECNGVALYNKKLRIGELICDNVCPKCFATLYRGEHIHIYYAGLPPFEGTIHDDDDGDDDEYDRYDTDICADPAGEEKEKEKEKEEEEEEEAGKKVETDIGGIEKKMHQLRSKVVIVDYLGLK